MSPAHDSPYSTGRRQQIPTDPQSVITAVGVLVAWLIAFVGVSLITLL